MLITIKTHPRICYFLRLIEEDNGGHLIGTVYPGVAKDFNQFNVCDDPQMVEAAERGLQTLCDMDVAMLAMGDTGDADKIANRSNDLKLAHALGNVYFDNIS